MSKTVTLRTLNGVRNDVSPERFDRDANGRSTGFTDLQASSNLDLDETGKLFRRLGTQLISAGVMHSLYADDDEAYVVKNGVLCQLLPDLSTVPVRAVNGRVSMARIIDPFYWSDGVQSGRVSKGINTTWGITVPPTLSAVSVLGALRDGTYLFTMTYVRSTGEESGAPVCGMITLAANCGISFPALPVSTDPLVVEKRIYLTDRNEELPRLAGTVPNVVTSVSITSMPVLGMAVRTLFMGPPPAGQIVGYFSGRSLVASGNYLWYSQPHEYGLFDRRSAFVGFKTPLRTIASVVDGVFVGTALETYWLGGTDPAQWTSVKKAAYGTVLGTEVVPMNYLVGPDGTPGNIVGWMSHRGFCLGFDGGNLVNVTGGRHIPPVAREGASLLKIRGGTPQIVTTMFN